MSGQRRQAGRGWMSEAAAAAAAAARLAVEPLLDRVGRGRVRVQLRHGRARVPRKAMLGIVGTRAREVT